MRDALSLVRRRQQQMGAPFEMLSVPGTPMAKGTPTLTFPFGPCSPRVYFFAPALCSCALHASMCSEWATLMLHTSGFSIDFWSWNM